MKRNALCVVVVLLVLCGGAEAALASEPSGGGSASDWAYAIANDLMSPYCPGRTLAECPSPQAAELRAWILVQAAAGRTREDVQDELYERYGDQIRATPKAEGFGLTAYALPIAAFAAGGLLVVLALRRLTARASRVEPASGSAPQAVDPVEEAELQRIVDGELGR